MHALRVMKATLVASIGAWAVLVAYGNIVDYDANWQFVRHVLSMDTVFADNPLKSRAITDPTVQRAVYALIIATEWTVALLCLYGAWRLFRARSDRRTFIAAKVPAMLGLTLMWLLYFVGFVAIAAEWFSMWQSQVWNGQAASVRFLTCSMFVTVVLLLPEEDA